MSRSHHIVVNANELPGVIREAIRRQLNLKHHTLALEFNNDRRRDPDLRRLGSLAHAEALGDISNECARVITVLALEFDHALAMGRVARVLNDRSGFHVDDLDDVTRLELLTDIVAAVLEQP